MTIPKKQSIEYFKLAVQSRNLELKLFWQRSLFFAGFIAAIFIALYSVDANSLLADNKIFTKGLLLILGAFFSLSWCLANRGSKYWYEAWEQKVDLIEKECGAEMFGEWMKPQRKFFLYTSRLYSVSKLTIFLSDLVFVSWFLLSITHFWNEVTLWFVDWRVSVLVLPIIVALYLLIAKTRSTIPATILEEWRKP
jgi:hypothetical protein